MRDYAEPQRDNAVKNTTVPVQNTTVPVQNTTVRMRFTKAGVLAATRRSCNTRTIKVNAAPPPDAERRRFLFPAAALDQCCGLMISDEGESARRRPLSPLCHPATNHSPPHSVGSGANRGKRERART